MNRQPLYSKFKQMFHSAKKEILNEKGAEKELKDINLDALIGLTVGIQKHLKRLKNTKEMDNG